MKASTRASRRRFVLHTGMRTIKWWVCYRPDVQRVLSTHRTKKLAMAAQRYGEAIVQMRGHYFPADIRKPRRRAPTVTAPR